VQGLIHIYTGSGKGKTTAAFGLAARAAGHGKRVLFAQFLKGGGPDSGEIIAGKRQLLNMEIMRFQQVHPLFDPSVDLEKLAGRIEEDYAQVERLIMKGNFDMVILDEINNCVSQRLLSVEAILELMENKPEHLELVFTGRDADPKIMERADYVTEMRMVKHPAESNGTPARKGIEY
jgi:cob(I)alamin adenosyltransferase